MTDTMDEPTADDVVALVDMIDSTPVDHLLDRWLEESLAEVGDEPRDQEQVDRLLWVLRRLRQRRQEILDAAQARANLVTKWATEEVEEVDRRAGHLEETLEGWAQSDHEATGRRTWKLPAGTLTVRKRSERVVVIDAKSDATVAAVGAIVPEAVKTTHEVQGSKVKAVTFADGYDLTSVARSQGVEVPEGYQAQRALIAVDDDMVAPVPAVWMLVPVAGREGRKFSAVTE
ncbi:MAG TPA: host-nuclease inhibitor Gam family protein [Iamia sp.]|nr:host-nuclease inhibitor Gam family protein [Iamia sp.]